ncbi:putative HLH transcription factor [Talaromyces proteolyticus]|uniref:HLH transcription factor n=1 Tax=Talaromyces proteolyticus TaxID=1131652 RepID=A0AAD4KKG9_9EURO|nr:putative HLH transcription factor [Talaromyces proteolyticus]KAH8693266.1 putative HLH transcription factor [Talaromyces proteolyticus]
MSHSGYTMANQQFDSHFGNHNGNDAVDPSDLTMQNGMFMPYSFGSQQGLSAGYNMGNSGIDTDELLDLDLNGQNGIQRSDGMGFIQDQRQNQGLSMSHQSQMTQMYSHTPDGAPMHSPFLQGSFNNFDQFQPMNQHSQSTPSHLNAPSHFDQNFMNGKTRPSLQTMDRSSSDVRTPMTPKTPAIGALNLGTPESGSFPSQPIRAGNLQHRHQKTLSNQWDGTPGSAQSFIESPVASPNQQSHHANLSEVLKSGKHASLPAKVDSQSAQALESQEAKRRRRRASHNMVERRRRDNINERIQDLSHLVPQHRLEDDKIRKQLLNNSSLSPHGTSMSPPNATSLLAGGNGRRATAGNITMGLPIDEKEKGPNKGDILNGAVGWMRDLMWALHVKMQQEAELAELISSLGGTWPFEQTEDEKRMRTELLDAMDKNDPNSFNYSRAPGSGLRVPKHTNLAGDAVQNGALSPQSLSPAFNSGGSGANSGGAGQPQFWGSSGGTGGIFKEEDEYAMDI